MSSKISKSGVKNSKVLMTKWDVNHIERLTRSDFYNDNFQPRDAFVIPHGVSYPNERTMVKAMNEIQSKLRNGCEKEWKIFHWKNGARIVRLVDPTQVKARKPARCSGDVSRENIPVKKVISVQQQRKELITRFETQAKSPRASPSTKKVPRSIFTVHEKRKDVPCQNQHQEAVIVTSPPNVVGKKAMEKRDLEMTIHGLEDFDQYTHDQLQKILDVNKRFFQLNHQGNQSELSTKQIKHVLNSQQLPERNKMLSSLESQRAERNSYEETTRKNVCNKLGVKKNVQSEIVARKNCVSQDNKQREQSECSSDEKYVFADYYENSESSLFDSDSNTCDDKEAETKTYQMVESYIPPIHRGWKTGLGDQIGRPASKLKKRFATGGVILNEIEDDAEQGMSFHTNGKIGMSRSKLITRYATGEITVNDIEKGEGEGEIVILGMSSSGKGTSRGNKKSVPVAGSRFTVHTPQGRVCYDTRSINEYSRQSSKTTRKEPPVGSTFGSSHAINQRKKDHEIDRENRRLSKQIELIKTTQPKNSITFRTSRQEQLPFARIQRRIAKKPIAHANIQVDHRRKIEDLRRTQLT